MHLRDAIRFRFPEMKSPNERREPSNDPIPTVRAFRPSVPIKRRRHGLGCAPRELVRLFSVIVGNAVHSSLPVP
jgi:hypothetical protein